MNILTGAFSPRDRIRRAATLPLMQPSDWASLNDEQLLELRISKLGLRLEGIPLEPLIWQLYDELSARRLVPSLGYIGSSELPVLTMSL